MADRRCTQVTLAEDLRRRAGEARTKSATPVLAEALADLSAERGDVIVALVDLHRALVAPGVDPSSSRSQVRTSTRTLPASRTAPGRPGRSR
jgi:hypothetical protein